MAKMSKARADYQRAWREKNREHVNERQRRYNAKTRARGQVVVRTEKHCPRCNRTLDAAEFGRNKATADGLQDYCKCCIRIYWRLRRNGYTEV